MLFILLFFSSFHFLGYDNRHFFIISSRKSSNIVAIMESPSGERIKTSSKNVESDDVRDPKSMITRQAISTMTLSANSLNKEKLAIHQKVCVQRRPSWNEVHDPMYHGSEVAHIHVYRKNDLRRTRSCHDLPAGMSLRKSDNLFQIDNFIWA